MKHGIILALADDKRIEKLTVEENILLTSFAAPEPEPKTYTVEIDGRNGKINFTKYFGDVKYKNRTVTAALNIAKVGNLKQQIDYHDYLMNVYHGEEVKLYYWGQPDRYYKGTLSIGAISNGVFSLSLDAEPLAYIIKEKSYTVDAATEEKTLTVTNRGQKITPSFVVDGEVNIKVNGGIYALNTGTHKLLNIQFEKASDTVIAYYGSGTLTIKYQERVI